MKITNLQVHTLFTQKDAAGKITDARVEFGGLVDLENGTTPQVESVEVWQSQLDQLGDQPKQVTFLIGELKKQMTEFVPNALPFTELKV